MRTSEILLRASELQRVIRQASDEKADLIEIVVRDNKFSVLAKSKDKVIKTSDKVDVIDSKDWNYTAVYPLFIEIVRKILEENPEFVSFRFTANNSTVKVSAYVKNGIKLECVNEFVIT